MTHNIPARSVDTLRVLALTVPLGRISVMCEAVKLLKRVWYVALLGRLQ